MIIAMLATFAVPIVAAIVWRTRTHTNWSSLFWGFGVFAAHNLIRELLGQPFTQLWTSALNDLGVILPFTSTFWLHVMLNSLPHAILREGIRWLMFRYVATHIQSWKQGVMFALGYSILAALFQIGDYVTSFDADLLRFRYSLIETLTILRGRPAPWWQILLFLWHTGVLSTVFNVGTSLAVLLSVRRRAVWLLLAAILWTIVFSTASPILMMYFPRMQLDIPPTIAVAVLSTLARTPAAFVPFLLFVCLRQSRMDA